MSPSANEIGNECRQYLDHMWQQVNIRLQDNPPPDSPLNDHELVELIRGCLTSSTKTYHYVLPTQILAKSVDPTLDARSLQVAHDAPGAFDARTIAHNVIVPFDQQNYRVLGGSPEPYVNNPVRVPAVTADYRDRQRNKVDWDKLVSVLDTVQAADDPDFTQRVFEQVLLEIYALLAHIAVVYPTPNRISLVQLQTLLTAYLSEISGGERLEAVCTALFQTIGDEFGLFERVERAKVQASDASSGMLADIECWLADKIVLLVEVKDRFLTLTQLDAKLEVTRSRHISELLFVAQQGNQQEDVGEIEQRIATEFTSGQNIYISTFDDFAWAILILFGESGRVRFLDRIGVELDRVNAPIEHRRSWANALKSI